MKPIAPAEVGRVAAWSADSARVQREMTKVWQPKASSYYFRMLLMCVVYPRRRRLCTSHPDYFFGS